MGRQGTESQRFNIQYDYPSSVEQHAANWREMNAWQNRVPFGSNTVYINDLNVPNVVTVGTSVDYGYASSLQLANNAYTVYHTKIANDTIITIDAGVTLFATTAVGVVGLYVAMDGVTLTRIKDFFFNELSAHREISGRVCIPNISLGQHRWKLYIANFSANAPTINFDGNDSGYISVSENWTN